MRLILLALSFLFLLSPVSAAPAPSPWVAPDRELITDMAEGKYYFLRSSVQVSYEGINVDTVMEYDQSANDSSAKYVLQTVRIAPFADRIKPMSSKGYNSDGVLLFDHPPEEWQTPSPLTHDGLVPAVIKYWQKNMFDLETKNRSASDNSWYTKGIINSSGDTYYYHPGWIIPKTDFISASIRVVYGKEKKGAKFLEQYVKVDPIQRRYHLGSITFFDNNGNKVRSLPAENSDVWHNIEPGTELSDLFLQIFEYCRKSYITLKIPFQQAFPHPLIPFYANDPALYFNPESILVRDGYLWVERIYHTESFSFTSLAAMRLSDHKISTTGTHTYDAAGNEVKRLSRGIQWWFWYDIKPGSIEEHLFDAVFAYCRDNGIALDK